MQLWDCVYVIQCNEFYKIGVARNLAKRLNEMQTGNPYELRVVLSIEVRGGSSFDTERFLHTKFQAYRVRREWFQLPPEAVEWMRSTDVVRLARSWTRSEGMKREIRRRFNM